MKLFGYYALHTFWNMLRKLLKSWLVFILICILMGGLIGAGIASIVQHTEQAAQEEPQQTETVETVGPEEPEPTLLDRLELDKNDLIELAVGLILLVILIVEAVSADKSGGRIFQPADVALLFSSPMQPQSVLMFRLATQLGVAVLAGLYMLFQLPNLIFNLGLSVFAALMTVVTWGLTIALGRLIQVLFYLLCSSHPRFKQWMRRGVYLFCILVVALFALVWRGGGSHPLRAAVDVFNAPVSRWIPVWGWLKGFLMFAVEGNIPMLLLSLALALLAGLVLILVIRRTRADFYEDAMAKSEETAALREAAKERKGGFAVGKRKKDRSETLERDGLNRGCGANVLFFRTLYNRRRFAVRGVLTKTMETYLAVAVGMSMLCRFAFGSDSLTPAALAMAALAFFRSLGNPLEQDTGNDYFRLIPESAAAKLFWSLLGGTVCCLLDALPAMLLAVVILRSNPLPAPGWLLFIASVDFFATAVGSFIGAAVPVSGGKSIKQIIQILFLYFGLLPDAAIIAVGLMSDRGAMALLFAAALNAALGLLFLALTGRLLSPRPTKR